VRNTGWVPSANRTIGVYSSFDVPADRGVELLPISGRFWELWVMGYFVSEVCMAKKVPKKSTSQDNQHTKLSAAELETYKTRLLTLRTRIQGDVSTMTDGALSQSRSESAGDLSSMPLHMADIGSDNFEQEQTLSFIQSDHNTLALIDEALLRIKDGTYGICESCGKPIPKVRLNVLPYAADCVKCVELSSHER
jgi:RNA polymerase-binding transcription factor DksA